MSAPAAPPLLVVEDLHVVFDDARGTARAVDGISFSVARGETVAIVGESGCGKSVTALALLGLVEPPGRVSEGRLLLEGRPLHGLDEAGWTAIRGRRIGLVFQEPSSALTPVLTIGAQMREVAARHLGLRGAEARAHCAAMLGRLGITDPDARLDQYPHELSGGMRQRVVLALALLARPDLLIADEPTTALDVTVQAEVLGQLADVRARDGTAVLLITHDLGVVAEVADRVLVMYAGQIVESAPTAALFADPQHPYTAGLLAARPGLAVRGDALPAIPGTVPPATDWPAGCRFAPRCPHAWARCAQEAPALAALPDGRAARCHLVDEPARRAAPAR